MGCGIPYTQQQSANYDIHLEYSVDYGQSWELVEKECLQSSYMCTSNTVHIIETTSQSYDHISVLNCSV